MPSSDGVNRLSILAILHGRHTGHAPRIDSRAPPWWDTSA